MDNVNIKKIKHWKKYPHKFMEECMGFKFSIFQKINIKIRLRWIEMRNKHAKLS